MKGWKTVAFGLGVAVLPSALTYLAGVDWTKLVSPDIASIIVGAATIALRAVTNTSIGKSS